MRIVKAHLLSDFILMFGISSTWLVNPDDCACTLTGCNSCKRFLALVGSLYKYLYIHGVCVVCIYTHIIYILLYICITYMCNVSPSRYIKTQEAHVKRSLLLKIHIENIDNK